MGERRVPRSHQLQKCESDADRISIAPLTCYDDILDVSIALSIAEARGATSTVASAGAVGATTALVATSDRSENLVLRLASLDQTVVADERP